MNQRILQWSLTPLHTPASLSLFPSKLKLMPSISATFNSLEQHEKEEEEDNKMLPARERRKLRNERRESKAYNWKDEVEMKLIKKPKKRYSSWTEELNLDTLAHDGPQWWVVRISRAVTGQYSAERLATSLASNYPDLEFKMYIPAVQEKRRLKNGTVSVKPKPLFPGCVFLRCLLNKEIHDFIRECEGIGGFVGSKVGNTIRQINKPRPVSEDDMEKIFQQAKEEQEKADLAFLDQDKSILGSAIPDLDSLIGDMDTAIDLSSIGQNKKLTEPARRGRKSKFPKLGSTVKVVSGSFAEFSGGVKKVDKKNGKVTVGFTIFGKETVADLNIQDIVVEEE